ncbi:hypothetical protein EWM64_g2357 [Hericium alpestre]|uniref:Uncharacterized protein n=1 Tax=Hericium alpestre TaxID=135208 RepID=A0A4Z0A3R1_9AGAM|nr:hypothetical protein EWM64_g2357 [Hericium alpestre]
MSSPLANKKRKRADSGAEKLTVELSSLPASQVGPVLANFPTIRPSKSTAFQCYAKDGEDGREFARQATTLSGETDTMEFTGANATEDDGLGSRYFIAVHHPSTGKVTLQPAPLFLITPQVKALKTTEPAAPTPTERLQARTALGATSVYRHLSYLRLVAILPWFTLLFAAVAAGVLFIEPSPRAEYTESEEPTREMDEKDEKDEKKLVV